MWAEIKHLPNWADKLYWKWRNKFSIPPYDTKKHFVGKNHIYKIKSETHGQGNEYLFYYVKRK